MNNERMNTFHIGMLYLWISVLVYFSYNPNNNTPNIVAAVLGVIAGLSNLSRLFMK